MTTSYALTLKATLETSVRLWNDALITSTEKGRAKDYLIDHRYDLAKVYALNKRMGELILLRTPRSQRL